jgi:thiol-disulfide isomerase/thioredoxin
MTDKLTRRAVLAGAGSGVAALAGCLGGGGKEVNWRTATVEDATTGETFSIADADEPVVLHTFATWCSTCLRQQQALDTVYERRGDEVTMVDLTIDDNDDPGEVADHAESNGFGWRFGVASARLTRSLAEEFGNEVAVAPQAPVVVVCPDGTATELNKGVSADGIEETIDTDCA